MDADEIKQVKQKVLEDVDPPTKKKKKHMRRMSWLRTILEFAAIIVVICGLFQIVMGISYVEGQSMYPTLHDKDMVVYKRRQKTYVPGDIIAIERPNDEEFVKRVVAVAGDTVNIEGGRLYVNGKELEEPWALGETKAVKSGIVFPITVTDGEVFVLGDNRENSEDSRMFGPVKISDTKGRLVWYIGKL
ncbi:hypothetical protein CE91St62_38830 [Lachnospiraceae bacterium]|uniref:signal peptidase I n=1 Tax=Extibacter sp. GGCC_0201 TaxID=2731209 RepID=UPI001AA0CB2C|nr:signal peptidase I [Extibacter sp. GGCC_0201]MBO1719782.1 signal peptidase I [Extibacter sp. GGCC_0201]BDF35820.1 hypothetical protein CE91St61_38950 [Lachnospiraceae bacterium]BDF39822.1 hypothetical protein CE91St62_38830 [Lachnospiraceae bacterium]